MYSDEFTVTPEQRIEKKLDQLLGNQKSSNPVSGSLPSQIVDALGSIKKECNSELKFTQREIEILNRKSADDATHFRNDLLYVKLRGTWYFYCKNYWHEEISGINENTLCPILKGE